MPHAAEETVTPIENANRPARLCSELRIVSGIRVVSLRGEIDHDVRDVLGEALRVEAGAQRPRIVADLSEVTFMDSSGINVFVAAYQQVSAAGGWVRIAAAQESVLRVLQLVGVDDVIPCRPSVEQAMAD
ncbi:STAS domain-containing protein [Streptomyces sp. NPDC002779]|uniref:STAS domain-containing protein n=1 Tax=Streptomyces sp. NPDC002779 TaxID=3364664 RepID=UPI003697C74E